jgi:glycosyltransferase involved in cell wall biosynthesis
MNAPAPVPGLPGAGRLVMVSTYPPRRCGLATFTRDLRAALAVAAPGWRVDVAAIDRGGVRYGTEVLTTVRHDDAADYRRAAALIEAAGTDLVVIQHEYGIFGGADGRHVLALAAELRRRAVPYVVTLHTVLSAPTEGQSAVLRQLCAMAAAVTVFTPGAQALVARGGSGPRVPVGVVPHGAPVVLRERGRAVPATSRLREVLPGPAAPGTAGPGPQQPDPAVLTTFGLIGPGKGLEQVIAALPAIVARHPQARYVIAGATHPEVLRSAGESYRDGLVALAARLGVAGHVRFLDAFLSDVELAELLANTTIYLTPYRGTEQVCSGTLAFALVAGCPVISTPYRYAQEILVPRDGTAPGVLVPRDDVAALAGAACDLLDDPVRLAAVSDAAYTIGAELTWPSVAARFAGVYTAAVPSLVATRERYVQRLDHLDRLTDATGIIQFGRGPRPDRGSGYCVDDVARLALVAQRLVTGGRTTGGTIDGRTIDGRTIDGPATDGRPAAWLATSLVFLESAVAPGGVHNMLAPDGTWLDAPHLGDHVGRAIWAAGTLAAAAPHGPDLPDARELLLRMLPLTERLGFIRSLAYATLGLAAAAEVLPQARRALERAARRLDAARCERPDWCWFEPWLTYDNARLPQALLAAGTSLGERAMVVRAISTLDWYLGQAGLGGAAPEMLRCVDNRWRGSGHGYRSGNGDEQPLDAAATAEALVAAWQATGDARYARLARLALTWFHGVNRAGVALLDAATGGCRDGLSSASANANQGAESTLAYHQALLALRDAGLVEVAVAPPAQQPASGPRTRTAGRRMRPAHTARPSPRRRPARA